MEKLGALAAFGTAVCWSISPVFLEASSRKFGALAVNFWKVLFALVLLTIAGTFMRGMPLPLDAPATAWLYLGISGIVGFVIADYFLLNAYILLGARTTVVFQAITPLFTAFFAWLLLGERMRLEGLLGMILAVTGIFIVVISRRRNLGAEVIPSPKGYLFALLSSLFQSMSLILSKRGVEGYNAVSATQIRMISAIVGFAIQAFLVRQTTRVFTEPPRSGKPFRNVAIASFFGPFLGVTLSVFAVQYTQAATASTLIALTPILVIPSSILILKQKVRPAEIAGAFLAVAGAAVFFMI